MSKLRDELSGQTPILVSQATPSLDQRPMEDPEPGVRERLISEIKPVVRQQ